MKNCIRKIAVLFTAAILVTVFSGCQQDAGHEHTFAATWTSDATNHWHAATCEHTDQVSGKAAHTFGDWNSTTGKRKCTVCDYEENCTHTWNGGEITTAATETAEGTKTYTCTVCGGTKTESINKLDHVHKFAEAWTSDATNHWHAAICEHTDQVNGKTAHTFGKWDSTTGKRSCTVCGYEENCTHTWNGGAVTTAAACTEKGVKTYTCTVCGKTRTEEIAATGHSFAEAWTSDATNHWHAATCEHTDQVSAKAAHTFGDWNSTTGKKTCTVCGYEENCTHTWNGGAVTTAATCTEKGVKTYTCTVCGKTRTEEIAATGHSFAEAWTSDATNHWHAATCGHTDQVSGKTAHTFGDWNSTTGKKTCTVCGYEENCTHTWNNGAVTTAATCTSAGVKTYTCTVCGKTRTEEIAATGHSFAEAWTSDATNHWHAATCEHTNQVSDKAEHTWNNGEITTAPTCTESGVKTYTCTVCSGTKTETVNATGHTEDSGTVTTAPTCFTNGTKTYKCSVCEKVLRTEVIDALGWCESVIDASTYKAATKSSTYVYFGVFPKTVLASGSTVTVDETTSVTMGGNTYYKGSDGEYYTKVSANPYKSSYKYSDTTDVTSGTERYFKVEPIKWKVLTTNYDIDGTSGSKTGALLFAEDILTANVPYYKYNSSSNTRTVDGVSGIYPNNYKYSQIRAYLNGLDYYYDTSSTETTKVETYNSKGFLQTAFTEAAQGKINTTTVVNNGLSTTDAAGFLTKADGTNSSYPTDYTCADTQDKIFLLSEKEATTGSYGFDFYDSEGTSSGRIRVTIDYAKANCAYQDSTAGNGGWWYLRSPFYENCCKARIVDYIGECIDERRSDVNVTRGGVVPALTISLQ